MQVQGTPPEHVLAGVVVGVTSARRHVEETEAFTRRGARVVHAPAVGSSPESPPEDRESLRRLVNAAAEGRIDALSFTSSAAVWNTVAAAAAADLREPLRRAVSARAVVVCTGAALRAAAEAGFTNVVSAAGPPGGGAVPAGAPADALADALAARMRATEAVAHLGGSALVLRAATVVVDGRVVELAPRERAVLGILLRRPGAVVAKEVMLRAVWDPDAEPHVVETAVNRLRRRLEGSTVGILTVHKRGYRLVSAGAATG